MVKTSMYKRPFDGAAGAVSGLAVVVAVVGFDGSGR
jgi:hypothetical protein